MPDSNDTSNIGKGNIQSEPLLEWIDDVRSLVVKFLQNP